MKKLIFALPLLAIVACGGGKTSDNQKVASADSTKKEEPAVVEQKTEKNVKKINFDKILYKIINSDTVEVNTYDSEGRILVHRYMRQHEESPEEDWSTIAYTYRPDGQLATESETFGEWIDKYVYEYDSENRLIKKSSGDYVVNYTWDGLTRSDDGFCRNVVTFADKTYKQIVNEKSYLSNNGPISSEYTYDKDGKILSDKYYKDGVLDSERKYEYKDKVKTEFYIVYKTDGSVEKSFENIISKYFDSEYKLLISNTDAKDGEIYFTNSYDENGYITKCVMSGGDVTTYTYDGNVQTEKGTEQTVVTAYVVE